MIYVEDKSFLNFRNYFMTWGETKTALLKDEWSGVEWSAVGRMQSRQQEGTFLSLLYLIANVRIIPWR